MKTWEGAIFALPHLQKKINLLRFAHKTKHFFKLVSSLSSPSSLYDHFKGIKDNIVIPFPRGKGLFSSYGINWAIYILTKCLFLLKYGYFVWPFYHYYIHIAAFCSQNKAFCSALYYCQQSPLARGCYFYLYNTCGEYLSPTIDRSEPHDHNFIYLVGW